MTASDDRRPPGRSLATTVAATLMPMLTVSPVFLLGGLAAFVRAELGFDEAVLGLLTGVFFASSAVLAIPGGRLADRIGARAALLTGLFGTAVSLLGIAVGIRSWPALVGWLVLAGAANGVVHPAANLGLIRGVVARRRGLAFGVKQSAIPLATLLAGLSVPTIGLTFGWRWVFALAAALCLPLAVTVARTIPGQPAVRWTATGIAASAAAQRPNLRGRGLAVIGLAGACGGATATSLGMFFVESTATGAVDVGTAGLLLSFGSVLCIVARLLAGWFGDRSRSDLTIAVGLQFLLGALGVLLLALQGPDALLLVATAIAFMAGWGWAGLLQFAVVRQNMDAPAAVTGIVQTGVYLGNVAGPIAFGSLVAASGYAIAWAAAAGVLVVGAALLWVARRRAGTPTPATPGTPRRTGTSRPAAATMARTPGAVHPGPEPTHGR